MGRVEYITPEDLAGSFADGSIADCLIIDVREADYTAGKIKGSIHIPFHEFEGALDRVDTMLERKTRVIFHCYFSQTRGPRAASIFLAHLKSTQSPLKVQVLEGGWKTFRTFCAYKGHQHCLEDIPSS